ncbi:MAG: phosphoribosyltransferase [Muribaculaceae bacterium]|nr:phosphoribosyltransferase [Muribaculaceae bacterium]
MDLSELSSFLDSFSPPSGAADGGENLFSKKRKAWHSASKEEPRCDFAPDRFRLNARGLFFLSLWKRSIYGPTLSEIKADPEMVEKFIQGVAPFIRDILGHKLGKGQWAIITPPPRRHIERNFAQRVAAGISEILNIPFHPDVARAKNRQRVMAEFDLVNLPPEPNLIVFDDICTTASTFQAMRRLLLPHEKNLIFFAAINNKA